MRAGENRQAPAKPRQNGSAIRDFRKKTGMSRRELAEQARISPPHMANIENEHKDASYEVLYRLKAVLVVDIRSILRDPPTLEALDDLTYDEACEQAS
ncbi:helix-turn-helix domain-containing protein [Actinomadura sp. ATCC 39365]